MVDTIRDNLVRAASVVVVVGVAVVVDIIRVISVALISGTLPPVVGIAARRHETFISLQPALRGIVTLFVCIAPGPN